jgi:DNA-directed RNA polymerase subunit RPC12/RpoP
MNIDSKLNVLAAEENEAPAPYSMQQATSNVAPDSKLQIDEPKENGLLDLSRHPHAATDVTVYPRLPANALKSNVSQALPKYDLMGAPKQEQATQGLIPANNFSQLSREDLYKPHSNALLSHCTTISLDDNIDDMASKAYKCDECGLLFGSTFDLQRHIRNWCPECEDTDSDSDRVSQDDEAGFIEMGNEVREEQFLDFK